VTGPNEVWEVLTTPYFRLEKLTLTDNWLMPAQGSFQILFVASGKVEVRANGLSEVLSPGSTCMVPAALPSYETLVLETPSTVLRVTAP
jgi:mannose-6-phosphate isomerase class I